MANNLFTLGLNVAATKEQMNKQLKQIAKDLSDGKSVKVTGGLNLSDSQRLIQQQLNTISKNLKLGVNVDTVNIKQQIDDINKQVHSNLKTTGVKVPFQFDLSDAKAVKEEINKIVAEITNNQGQLIRYKINLDENGQATRTLLTYRNELNEVTQATLHLKEVGKWSDAQGIEHQIVEWTKGSQTLSQNIEATIKANQKQIDVDNQVIRKKQELIAQMKLLNTQSEKAGLYLDSDNQKAFNDLSVNASTVDDIKQLENYLRLARTEYQTLNAEITKGVHASSIEAMSNNLENMGNNIALVEAKFKSIKMPETVSAQIEQLKSDMDAINSITEPTEKITKYNQMVSVLQSLQKEYQVTAQEQKNLNTDFATMQGANALRSNIVSWMASNRNSAEQYDTVLKQIIQDTQNLTNKTDLTRLEQQFRSIKAQADATNKSSIGLFSNLKTQLGEALTNMLRYQLAYKIIQDTTQAIKDMVNEVSELDASLTEFNKVADLSTEQLTKFADRAYEASTQIGRTGRDMIDSATEFKRAGYDLEQSLAMGNAALVMTNVADGIDNVSDASGTLISVLKGFKMGDTDIMSIVSKMNSVSNQSPVGFDNLANGLERVSGTMSQAGNSIDETIGLLTGGFAQLRNIEKVSSGLITISQRLRAVDEDGNAIDGLSAELENSFGKIGVKIEDANGDLRSTYDILHDYAKVFPTLTSEQKQYFGELSAGKRQVNVFNAIVQQMSDVDKAINQSIDSIGSAERENEIYRQSVQGLKNEFDNAFQILSQEVISSDWVKDLIISGTDLLNVLTNIVEKDELISGTIGLVTDGIKGLANILDKLTDNDAIGMLISGFLTLKTVSKGVDLFNFVKGKSNSINDLNSFFRSVINDTNALSDAQRNASNSTLLLDNSTKKLGNTLKDLMLKNPILTAITVAGTAIYAGIKIYDSLTISVDEAKESLSEFKDKHDEIANAISSKKQTVEEIGDSYDELAKGVQVVNGELSNVSLSNEDYDSFVKMNQTLADTFPQLIEGIDANGVSILNLGKYGKTAKEELQDLIKTEEDLSNFRIAQDSSEQFKNVSALIKGVNKDLESINQEIDGSTDAIKQINDIATKGVALDIPITFNGTPINEAEIQLYNLMARAKQEFLNTIEAGEMRDKLEYAFNLENGLIELDKDVYFTDEQREEFSKIAQSIALDMSNELKDAMGDKFSEKQFALEDISSAWRDFIPTMVATMRSKQGYKDLDDTGKEIADRLVNSLDENVVADLEEIGIEDYLRKNIVNQVAKLNDNQKMKLSDLYDVNSSLTQEERTKLRDGLQREFKEQGIEISIDVIPTVANNIEQSLGNTKDVSINLFSKEQFTEAMSTLSSVKGLYDDFRSNLDEGMHLTIDITAIEKLRETLQETSENVGVTVEEFDAFEQVLTSNSSTVDDMQRAFDDIATSYANATLSADGYSEEVQEMVKSQLELQGITSESASEFVDYLATMEQLRNVHGSMAESMQNDFQAFVNEAEAVNIDKNAILEYWWTKQTASGLDILTSDAINSLAQEFEQLGYNCIRLREYANLKSMVAGSGYIVGNNSQIEVEKQKRNAEELARLSIQEQLNNKTPKLDWSSIGKGASKAGKDAGKDYKDALESELSTLDSVISHVTSAIDKNIDALEKQKDTAINALEAEKDAALEAIEAQKDAIQGKIDDIDDEIDAMKRANEQRSLSVSLQQKEYDLQRMMNQKTILSYSKDKGMHYETDTSQVREKKQEIEDVKLDITISKLEEEKAILEKEIDLLDEKAKKIEESYDKQIKALEMYYDALIENMEKSKDKFTQLKEVMDNAEISAKLQQLGIDEQALINGSEEEFNKLKNAYMDVVTALNSGNDSVLSSLNELNGTDFNGISSSVESVGKGIKTVSDNSEIASKNISSIKDSSTIFDSLAQSLQGISDALGIGLADEVNNLVTALENLSQISLGDEKTGIIAQFDALKVAVDNVTSAIGGGGGSEGGDNKQGSTQGGNAQGGEGGAGGTGGITKALDDLGTKAEEVIGTAGEDGAEGSGVIGKFGALKTSVSDVVTAIGEEGGEGAGSETEEQALIPALQILGEIGVEINDLLQQEFEDTASKVEAITSAVIRLSEALNGLSIGGGSVGNGYLKGTVGNAFANGTHYKGLDKDEKNALRSEYGQKELTVYPNGQYEITNTPIISDLPKDTVIFNEEQTEKILETKPKKHEIKKKDGSIIPIEDYPKYTAMMADMLGIYNPVLNMYQENMQSDIDRLNGNVTNNMQRTQNMNFSTGDIVVQGVQNTDGLAKAIKTHFPNAMLQAMHKH